MKIMTFNLRCDFFLDFNNRWDIRKNLVFDIIHNYNCDIIGTQEDTNKMFEDISNNISEYNIIGNPRSKKLFSERNDLLISKENKIIDYKTFWLSETPEKVGSSKWYSVFPRICTTAILELKNGKKIRVCNSHLDCFFSKARTYELNKLLEFIKKEQQREELPLIIMGDFNSNPNSKLIKNFTSNKICNKRLVAVQEVNKDLYNKATMGHFKGKENGTHIDYIFVSEEFEIVDVEIIKYNIDGKYPSDHYPLMAEVNIN
ncbi:endonuclease/exonuclease/phosphatase family protein [Clostridium weizhouense]|uniref:Endonuclease/exonuclease/phosphatase family protein n=1 Tax=Clostridium weizhouense TaxID=2859781 RepID=A0ABS7AM02_9CLOT|nr:endonuclease/exonuclease/phosphatase family protein [Clostridium weizhouense]MBW6409594.1 endonuclease/exonuclease/phosphatase family protein [Clostridium weizhouense]